MNGQSFDRGNDHPIGELGPARSPTSSLLERARSVAPSRASSRRLQVGPWVRGLTYALRRGHLYAGLMMLPWVFLYGVTGLLFNHPTWFSDQTVIPFGKAETTGTPLEQVPTPAEIAGQVVAALNDRGEGGYRLSSPQDARYERGGLAANVLAGDGKSYTVAVNPDGEGGSIREGAGGGRGGTAAAPAAAKEGRREAKDAGEPGARDKGAAREGRGGRGGEGRGTGEEEGRGGRGDGPGSPFDRRAGLRLATSPLARLEEGLPLVLAKVGLAGARITEVRAAPLTFLMEGAGKRWLVTYTISSGAVAGRLADAATAGRVSTRRFLTGMHTTHGYPATFNARWIWAVIVDLMSSIMVFWGISGVVMWWQIKRTRRIGAAVLVASVVAAVFVGMGMHDSMAIPGGR